jgi:signal peptidase I
VAERDTRAAAAAASPPRKGILRDYFETIVVCVIFVIFSRAYVFQQSKIPTGSMEDTLLVGDYIMVNRFAYAPTATGLERALLPVRDVRRGDVIVFKFPEDPDTDFIKRVIGLPGDTVAMRGGITYINGKPLDEPYITEGHHDYTPFPPPGIPPVTVPPGKYFVMGDHRNNSRDSRVWGFVPKELIRGRAFIIWFSYPEAPNEYMLRGMDWVKAFLHKLIRAIPDSRWSRCFTIIR